MQSSAIKLGSKVRDKITGFEGTAVSRIEYLTGCEQIGVSPRVDKDGKLQDSQYFDWTRLEVVTAAEKEPARTDRGGPNRDAPR